jgi:hypothetical protein
MPNITDLLDDTIFYRQSNEDLIKTAYKFSAAQRDLASNCKEDSEFWHHVALADLLSALARRLAEEK